MNYVKHTLALLFVTGFFSAHAQPIVEFSLDVAPIVETIKAYKKPLQITALTAINALCAKFFFDKADQEEEVPKRSGDLLKKGLYLAVGSICAVFALIPLIDLQISILNS